MQDTIKMNRQIGKRGINDDIITGRRTIVLQALAATARLCEWEVSSQQSTEKHSDSKSIGSGRSEKSGEYAVVR